MPRPGPVLAALLVLPLALPHRAAAQDASDLNLQVHGYATQAFIYSTINNWNTTDSTEGSAEWTEAVVNVTAQPEPRLRIGVQARYFLLGNYGNTITLDWAQADYKINDRLGIRAGKVKSPIGMLNEVQDIDPAYLWILLPQSVYPIASRNTLLAHFGGVVYGALPLGERGGKLEYRLWGGERRVPSDDGYFQPLFDRGLAFPMGLSSRVMGATLRWNTPLPGLSLGVNASRENPIGLVVTAGLQGQMATHNLQPSNMYLRYERGRFFFGGEYNRTIARPEIVFPGIPPTVYQVNQHSFYAMTSYHFTPKLAAGAYYSSSINLGDPVSSARFQKDWTFSARYDANPFLYLKAEQHILDGTGTGYSTSDNPNGLQPNSRMTLLKLGVTF